MATGDLERPLYSTWELLGVFYHMEPVQTMFSDMFMDTYMFTGEFIEFSKIRSRRQLAPFVLPTQQGRPIFGMGETVERYKPAYIKPKDALYDTDVAQRVAGLGHLIGEPQTPKQQHDALIAAIMQMHNETIRRRWEWMAAQAIIYGKVTIQDEGYPEATVDFRRASAHTKTRTSGSRWGDTGVDIFDDLQAAIDTMGQAKFGGAPNKLILGKKVWPVFSKDSRIEKLLNKDLRNTSNTRFNLGLGDGMTYELKGYLNNNLPVYAYWDYYENADGDDTDYMPQTSALLINEQGMRGAKCFGTIFDKKANFQPLPIFPKMWDTEDPGSTMIMCQSAPLFVPVYPNYTYHFKDIVDA